MMYTMKCMTKNMFLIGLGVGATIAYQKYSKPLSREIEKLIESQEQTEKSDKQVEDMDKGTKWLCPLCGHIHYGEEAPEKCPLCGVPGNTFVKK